MNLVLHHFRKDVRHVRWLVGLWLAIVLFNFLLAGWGPAAPTNDTVGEFIYGTIRGLVPILQWLAMILLVPFLIHDEPLVGSTTFWPTRPISPGLLLRSKALFILTLLILPPLITESVILTMNHVTASDILFAMGEIILLRLAFIMVLVALSAVSSNYGRFILTGVLLLFLLMVISFFLEMSNLHSPDRFRQQVWPTLMTSRTVLSWLIIIIAGGGITIHQYWTRKTIRSLILVAGGTSLVLYTGQFSKWDIFAKAMPPVLPQVFNTDAVTVGLDSGTVGSSEQRVGRNTQRQIRGEIQMNNIPKEFFLQPEIHDWHLQYGNKTFQSDSSWQDHRSNFENKPWYTDCLEANLKPVQVINAGLENSAYTAFQHNSESVALLKIADKDYEQYAQTNGVYSATVQLNIYQYRVAHEFPLQKGARFDRGSEHIVISDILKESGGVTIHLRGSNLQLRLKGDSENSAYLEAYGPHRLCYLLCNRNRNEAFMIYPANDSAQMDGTQDVQCLKTWKRELHYTSNSEKKKHLPTIDEAWLAGATLLRIETVEVGALTKPVVVDKFVLDRSFTPGHTKKSTPEVPVELRKLVLPENPTRGQVRTYIDQIFNAPQSDRTRDLQQALLLKIGSQNLDLLMEHGCECQDYLIEKTVRSLAGPEHKELILKALPVHKVLVDIVALQGWQTEAKPILLGELKKTDNTLPPKWIQIIASYKDPATYEDLKAYLIHGANKQATYNAIKKLPDIDLSVVVPEAWRRSKFAGDVPAREMAPVALEYGQLDAVRFIIESLDDSDIDEKWKDNCRKQLIEYTGVSGTDSQLAEWFKTNAPKLVFDPAQKKFVVSSKKLLAP